MDDGIKAAKAKGTADPEKGVFESSSHASGSEAEKQDLTAGTTVQLKRKLQSRHLQMIAIGMLQYISKDMRPY